jgi:hypothetical protein
MPKLGERWESLGRVWPGLLFLFFKEFAKRVGDYGVSFCPFIYKCYPYISITNHKVLNIHN